jgi:WD40 repeat protein
MMRSNPVLGLRQLMLRVHTGTDTNLQPEGIVNDVQSIQPADTEPTIHLNLKALNPDPLVECIGCPGAASTWVNAVAISPDGLTFACDFNDTSLQLWDLAKRQLLLTLIGHSGMISTLTFSPDGRTVASGSYDKTIKLWDLASRSILFTLEGHAAGVNAIAISPDGQTLVCGSDDRTIRVWHLPHQKLLHTLKGGNAGVKAIVISPDGRTCFSGGGDRLIKAWDLARYPQRASVLG